MQKKRLQTPSRLRHKIVVFDESKYLMIFVCVCPISTVTVTPEHFSLQSCAGSSLCSSGTGRWFLRIDL